MVEKRGISGGQKKRVNVGLEMVMEPSLLILDEPTSGLDSASSSLLLRALRREALEGINISVVVHQPRSAITIPQRVNTPDHLIDILEGITKPGGNVTAKQLPVQWMLHNGYRVPPDMLHLCDRSGTPSSAPSISKAGEAFEQSFSGEISTHTSEGQLDFVHYNFFTTPDLSNRVTPGVIRLYRYYLGRVIKQRTQDARVQAADYVILLLAGACLGTMADVSDATFGYAGYQYTVIAHSYA